MLKLAYISVVLLALCTPAHAQTPPKEKQSAAQPSQSSPVVPPVVAPPATTPPPESGAQASGAPAAAPAVATPVSPVPPPATAPATEDQAILEDADMLLMLEMLRDLDLFAEVP